MSADPHSKAEQALLSEFWQLQAYEVMRPVQEKSNRARYSVRAAEKAASIRSRRAK